MSDPKINGAVEFVAFDDEQSIDAKLTAWLKANPNATVVDVKYQVLPYQQAGKYKMAKFALVLYHSETEVKKMQSASTMVMSLRKDLELNPPEE